ncbi:ATP-binding protein [Lysinibacillus telephonicus]|uniref:AAA family ATPase n=1 Tax=Lysinibacillus telephonicus TaxID=1714840 RepID=A0A431UTJ5_9BACI|nr:ATP-binding protein [Lysinibacillus telephonicus]RTQ92964.1 AAA family ATPase [Lysinibacillus telephonicus]
MIVHSLSGPSGTGKSTSAIQFAYEHQIEAIIDDGLLIINGEKKAGTSAKFEKNTITAVRRAIFQDHNHKKEVIDAIHQHKVQSILIIGTSDKMTKQIASRLEIAPIHYFHHIEEIRTNKEIQMAKFVRGTQGKHVMPVPYKQVEQNFFKRFIQRGFDIISKTKVKLGETTIVQPDFHKQVVNISRNVYVDLIKHTVAQCSVVLKAETVQFTMKQFNPIIYISLIVKGPVNYHLVNKIRGLQQAIGDQFIQHFEFEPQDIRIFVKGIQ